MATYTESFTAADDTLVSSLSGWSKYSSSMSPMVNSNSCAANTGGGAPVQIAYYNTAVASAHYAKVTITALSSQNGSVGPAIRCKSDSDSCFFALVDDGTVYCGEVVNGSVADWSGTEGFIVGDVVELSVDQDTSTTIYLKKNGSIVTTYTGKDALTGGYAGVCANAYNQETLVDSWEGGDVGGAAVAKPKLMNSMLRRRRQG